MIAYSFNDIDRLEEKERERYAGIVFTSISISDYEEVAKELERVVKQAQIRTVEELKQLKEKGRIRYIVKRTWGTVVWTVQLIGVIDRRAVVSSVVCVRKAHVLERTWVEVSLLNTRLTPLQKASSYG